MKNELNYESPKVRIVKAIVEKGFAASGGTEQVNRAVGSWGNKVEK